VRRLENPASLVEWNTDKRYLAELGAAGLAVVPTTWVRPGDAWQPERAGHRVVVIKPAVSLAALDSGRYDVGDPGERGLAADHVARLQQAGRTVMVQPYLTSVERTGESSLMFFDGTFSHAVRKPPALAGPDRGPDHHFLTELPHAPAHRPSAAELAVAGRALDAIPGGGSPPLFARVDLVAADDGAPLIMEVELVEPNLYYATDAALTARFVAAIERRLERP
jgi:hypothetical protein